MKNKHNILVGSEIERSNERIDLTGEVFTPMELCVEMVNEIPLNIRQNPDSTFLDIARKEHMPKKYASNIFSIKIAFAAKLK